MVHSHVLDIRYSDAVNDVVKTIVDQYGPITCLVNNAGGQISALAAQTSTNALDSVVHGTSYPRSFISR